MKTFTGLDYLYINIASTFGLDKENWDTRIQWTKDNMSVLESKDVDAKSKILYRKAVRALRATERGEETGFMMSLDACSSGVQILSTLMGCEAGARNSGLIDTGKREDFYSNVTDHINQLLGTANVWNRESIKTAGMTVLYGSRAEPKKAFGEDTKELAAFYQSMDALAPGAMRLMQIIQSLWDPTRTEYRYVMPDGHVVVDTVTVKVDKKVEVDEMLGATFTHRAEIICPKERGLSLAANLTHAVDSFVVREMLRKANKQGFELTTIHDDFFTHPNHMQKVRENYRDIFIDIAKSDLLVNMLRQISNNHEGTLDKMSTDLHTKIKTAEYLLS